MKTSVWCVVCVVLTIASPPPPENSEPPTTPAKPPAQIPTIPSTAKPTTPAQPPATVPTIMPTYQPHITDFCHDIISQECFTPKPLIVDSNDSEDDSSSEEESSSEEQSEGRNYMDMMKCVNTVHKQMLNSTSSSAAKCESQMKGSIAVSCVAAFEMNCMKTSSFDDLKECVEDNLGDFSSPCQTSINTFKNVYERLRRTLPRHKHDQCGSMDACRYQWLWGGELVSDPNPKKCKWWHHKKHFLPWVIGIGVIILIFVALCVRHKRRRRAVLTRRGSQPASDEYAPPSAPTAYVVATPYTALGSTSFIEIPMAQIANA